MKYKITIIGSGNLGVSFSLGLLKSGHYKINDLLLTEKREHRIKYLESKGFNVTTNNVEAVKKSRMVMICVKPQQMSTVLEEIKSVIKSDQIVLYTVTGISLKSVKKELGNLPIFRVMPNTAIEICESMTCISYINAKPEIEKEVLDLYNKLGKAIIIEEDLMPAATVLGACGIAFSLRFMRAASQGGIEIGFSSELSQLITAQTLKGATQLILQNGDHPEKEIDKVTTPQGFTISGLNEMEHQGFSSALIKGLLASYNKLIKYKVNKS